MKKHIIKIFKPGERVMLKLDRAPPSLAGKIAIVQDPPYQFRIGMGLRRKPYLNIKWVDAETYANWSWPGSYFKRAPVERKFMPDMRNYLDTIADWPSG